MALFNSREKEYEKLFQELCAKYKPSRKNATLGHYVKLHDQHEKALKKYEKGKDAKSFPLLITGIMMLLLPIILKIMMMTGSGVFDAKKRWPMIIATIVILVVEFIITTIKNDSWKWGAFVACTTLIAGLVSIFWLLPQKKPYFLIICALGLVLIIWQSLSRSAVKENKEMIKRTENVLNETARELLSQAKAELHDLNTRYHDLGEDNLHHFSDMEDALADLFHHARQGRKD